MNCHTDVQNAVSHLYWVQSNSNVKPFPSLRDAQNNFSPPPCEWRIHDAVKNGYFNPDHDLSLLITICFLSLKMNPTSTTVFKLNYWKVFKVPISFWSVESFQLRHFWETPQSPVLLWPILHPDLPLYPNFLATYWHQRQSGYNIIMLLLSINHHQIHYLSNYIWKNNQCGYMQ